MTRIIIFLSIILFPKIDYAQENCNVNNTILWRVTKEGLKDTSYLFGSYHAFTSRFFNYHPGITDLILKTNIYACEADFSDLPDGYQSLEVPDSIKWKKFATRRQYSRISTFLKNRYHTSKHYLKTLDVYSIYSFFEMFATKFYISYMYEDDNSTNRFIDRYLEVIAKRNENTIEGLEEPVLHSTYFKNIYCNCKNPTTLQMKKQISTLDSLVKLVRFNLYRYEPKDSISIKNYFEMNLCYYLDSIPEESEIINNVRTRNHLWMPKLEDLLSTKPTFVNVGLLHLFYKFGLISLLREKGYTVEPVSLK